MSFCCTTDLPGSIPPPRPPQPPFCFYSQNLPKGALCNGVGLDQQPAASPSAPSAAVTTVAAAPRRFSAPGAAAAAAAGGDGGRPSPVRVTKVFGGGLQVRVERGFTCLSVSRVCFLFLVFFFSASCAKKTTRPPPEQCPPPLPSILLPSRVCAYWPMPMFVFFLQCLIAACAMWLTPYCFVCSSAIIGARGRSSVAPAPAAIGTQATLAGSKRWCQGSLKG